MGEPCFESLIAGLSATEQTARLVARDALVSAAIDHMRSVAHRMTRGFPQVRRWDETDDVVQGASLRLTRALDAVVPTDARHLLNLIATQVRRELIDLARRYAGAESFARYHETNLGHVDGQEVFRSDAAEDPANADAETVNSWSRFHEVADKLGAEDRELFNLVWYLGVSQEQAAKTLGCSVRTIARRWDIVKRHLLAELQGQAPN
jgi:RNA polymerase sigma factor (sigma-70 family)